MLRMLLAVSRDHDLDSTPCVERRGQLVIDRSPSSVGVRNSPENMLNTCEGTFFILKQLNQLLLSFEISSIENCDRRVKRRGVGQLRETVPPIVLWYNFGLRSTTEIKNPGKRISWSILFQQKNPRVKILSQLEVTAD